MLYFSERSNDILLVYDRIDISIVVNMSYKRKFDLYGI